MIVNSTDVKNNFGKYLRMTYKEDVIITSNGRKVARLTAYDEDYKKDDDYRGCIREGSVAYEVPPRKVTFEEFLEIRDSSEQRLEYIDGMIYLLASPKTAHQTALGALYITFSQWFTGKKCKPMLAPYDITLKRSNGNKNMVQPDLMVICDMEENLDERDYYMGVPALVLEILSEGTRSKDIITKLDLYMSTGVKEYWIVNPINREVAIYLFEAGKIIQNATYKGQEKARSFVFEDLGVKVAEIFE